VKVFVSSDFTGHYPVGSAAVVVAANEDEARALLTAELAKEGLVFDGTLKAMKTNAPHALILCNGEY
jgi:hypothetical protein